MRTEQQVSSPLSLSLWTDDTSSAALDDELVPLDALARAAGVIEELDEDAVPWPWLLRPVVLADASPGT